MTKEIPMNTSTLADNQKLNLESLKQTDLKIFFFQAYRMVYDEWSSPNEFSRNYIFVGENHEQAFTAFLGKILNNMVDPSLLTDEALKQFPYQYLDICSDSDDVNDFHNQCENAIANSTSLPKADEIFNSVEITYSENNTSEIPLTGKEITHDEAKTMFKYSLVDITNLNLN